jgi:hypothetical protein
MVSADSRSCMGGRKLHGRPMHFHGHEHSTSLHVKQDWGKVRTGSSLIERCTHWIGCYLLCAVRKHACLGEGCCATPRLAPLPSLCPGGAHQQAWVVCMQAHAKQQHAYAKQQQARGQYTTSFMLTHPHYAMGQPRPGHQTVHSTAHGSGP